MKKTVIYSPYVDSLLLKELLQKGISIDPTADFRFKGSKNLHAMLQKYEAPILPQSSIFKSASMVGTDKDVQELGKFLDKYHFTLTPSMPEKSVDPRVIECLALAFMEFIAKWPDRHSSKKEEYIIPASKSYTKRELTVSGFKLRKTRMKVVQREAVGALVQFDDDFNVTFEDITSYGTASVSEFEERIHGPENLYETVSSQAMDYYHDGHLVAPRINASLRIDDHLTGIEYINHNPVTDLAQVEKIVITGSGMLSKLELTEWGVKARSEAYASGRMILGASAHDRKPYYPLVVTHGLVFTIRHRDQCIFAAYIPQECFEKVGQTVVAG